MAGKLKVAEQEKGLAKGDKALTFDNNKDYVVVKLKSDGKQYVEHKHFADKLIAKKVAELVKDAEMEEVISNTQVLATKGTK